MAEYARRLDEHAAAASEEAAEQAAASLWLTRELAEVLAAHEDWTVRRRLAENPHCPPDVLTRLVNDKNLVVSGKACQNTSTPFDVVARNASNVRVVAHPDCPADRLLAALDQPAERLYALEHRNLPLETLDALVDTAESDDIAAVLSNPNLTHTQALRAATRWERPVQWQYYWAAHPNADPTWLAAFTRERLSACDEAHLLRAASNPSTPADALAAIVRSFRSAAARNVVIANPACPLSALHETLNWISATGSSANAALPEGGLAALSAAIAVHPHADHAALARIPCILLGDATTSDPGYLLEFVLAHARTPDHAHAVLQLADGWIGSLAALLDTAEAVLAA